MGLVTHLRNKPEAARRRILYGATITIFGIVLLFWVVSLPYQLADVSSSGSANQPEQHSPFAVVMEEAGGLWSDFTRGLNVIRSNVFGG